MEIIQISVPVLEKYSSIWSECIGYQPELFFDEMAWVVDIYCGQDDRTELSDLYREYIKIPPLSEERVPSWGNMDKICDFFMKISSWLPFELEKGVWQALRDLLNNTLKDFEMAHVGLLFLAGIYTKYKRIPDFGLTDFLHQLIGLDYTCGTRPNLLRLYRYLFDNKPNTMDTITLQIGDKEKLVLHNEENWFGQMAYAYLNKHLGVADMEEVLQELERDYPTAKKRGRKRENPVLDIVLISCYNLLKRSGFIPDGVLVSDDAIDFIKKYLRYLGVADEDDDKFDDRVYIRAKISSLLKIGYKPIWYTFPNIKDAPAAWEGFKDCMIKNYEPNDGYELHPILSARRIGVMLKKKDS